MNPFFAHFEDKPALVAPHNQAWFRSCLEGVSAEMSRITALAEQAGERIGADDDNWWGEPGSYQSYLRPYVVKGGVLQIPVKGVLLHDFPFAFGSWATGYDYIWRAFERGMSDNNVRGIALVVDSPGGMVAGCFEMVDKMYAMRGRKPIAGFASESAYSAAYATISVVDPGQLHVTRTGGVGSIGVVTFHVDYSGMMEQIGLKITFIHAGKHKVDGNAYEALPDDVKARIQARIDDLYSVFVSTVARNRGLKEKAVRDTEALTFGAVEATSNGLADKIGALDDSLADFSASLTLSEGDDTMADITQADLDAAVAAASTSAKTEGIAEGKKAGATEAVARINAIIGCENAKSRPAAALSAALDTDMTVEQANTFLGKLAVETQASEKNGAGAPKGMFQAAMGNSQNPGISAEGEEGDEGDKEMSRVDRALSLTKGPRKAKS